eukprot:jgi/Ulvmu1/137/UM001_0141.1
MSRKRNIDSDTSSETDSAPRIKRVKGVLSGTDSGSVSPTRSLASHFSLPQLLAQLRVFTVGTQAACTSFDHPVSPPSLCWSYRLCREASSTAAAPLTASPVFMHAFDILCNSILASSVDVVVAVLPQVQDVHSFLVACPGIQSLLESFLRGERPLTWECASPSHLLEFPAGTPVALHGGDAATPLSLTYSPFFSNACHAFAWGSVGYLHMLLHVLRLLCYLVVGHIIPAWHSGRCPWNHDDAPITHKRLAHAPLQPLSQGARPSIRVHPEATAPLHIGIDPGLWALSQLFRTSWVQVCAEPVTAPGSQHAQRGCLFCIRHARTVPGAAGDGGTLAAPHTAAMHEPAMAETVSCRLVANATASSRQASVAGNACITCAAAPLIVVQPAPGSAGVGVRGSEGRSTGGAVHVMHSDTCAAVCYPSAGRFSTRMHDNAPHEYVTQLVSLLGDHLQPRADQVRQLGSLQSFPEADGGRPGGAASGAGDAAGMHVDLMQGTWGAAVQRAVVNQEVAGRQGKQAVAPGLLGGRRACFVLPALGAPESLLRVAAGCLAQCQEARLFTGCHQ